MDRERQVAAIVREARKTRPRTSRTVWIAAIVVGVLGVVGFALAMTTDGSSPSGVQPQAASRLGFSAGLVIGLSWGAPGRGGASVALAITREVAVRDYAFHSERKSPYSTMSCSCRPFLTCWRFVPSFTMPSFSSTRIEATLPASTWA